MLKRVLFFLLVGSLGGASAARATVLYGVEFAGLTPLYNVNQATGGLAAIGPTGFDGVGDLTSDTRPGSFTLWGIRIASNELLTFDPATGVGTAGPTLSITDSITSIAFDPVTGVLYGNTTVGFGAGVDELYSIDPTTGVATLIGAIGYGNVYALGFDQSGVLFGISDSTDELIRINTGTGSGTLVGSTGLSLAFDLASRPEDGVMFVADSGTLSLYTIDTTTGLTTAVGSYGSATNVVGLAFSPVPEPATLTLLAGGLSTLALRRRLRRKAGGDRRDG